MFFQKFQFVYLYVFIINKFFRFIVLLIKNMTSNEKSIIILIDKKK